MNVMDEEREGRCMESSTRAILSSEQLLPKECLTRSRDISDYPDVKGGCARRRGCASGISWVKAMDVDKHCNAQDSPHDTELSKPECQESQG